MSQSSRMLVAREIKQILGGAFFLIHPVYIGPPEGTRRIFGDFPCQVSLRRSLLSIGSPQGLADIGDHP